MKFAEVLGQEDVKQKLIRSFHDGRIAHALLFLGPEGSGNFALALAFAQYISCKEKSEDDSCGICSTCRKFQANQFADLSYSYPYFKLKDDTNADTFSEKWQRMLAEGYYFDAEHWRSVLNADDENNKQMIFTTNEAVSIVRKVSFTSYEGGFKFMVIWGADLMKIDVANKLLKVLEEPPERTIFLLTANSMDTILPTIQSRVQTIYIPKLSDEEIESALISEGVSEDKAKSIAHFTDGNWWKAQQLVRSEDPNEFYSQQFQLWMRLCFKRDVAEIMKWADLMHQQTRDEQKDFVVYALDQVRQNLMLNYMGDRMARMNDSEKLFSARFAPFINDLNVMDLMHELEEAHRDVSRNAYSKMVFADLSLRVHRLLQRKA